MLITKDFVLLNFPKTGTTFARKVIMQAYLDRLSLLQKARLKFGLAQPPFHDLRLHKLKPNGKLNKSRADQHGKMRQIPQEFQDRQVVSIVRDPVDRYLSMYRFRRWVNFPAFSKPDVKKRFPHFPDLTFTEYLTCIQSFGTAALLPNAELQGRFGYQTLMFIQFYFRDPQRVIENLLAGDESWMQELASIRFLKQSNLNEELKTLLGGYGFTESELVFIDDFRRLNSSSNTGSRERTIPTINEDTIAQIKKDEAFLYKAFPEFA